MSHSFWWDPSPIHPTFSKKQVRHCLGNKLQAFINKYQDDLQQCLAMKKDWPVLYQHCLTRRQDYSANSDMAVPRIFYEHITFLYKGLHCYSILWCWAPLLKIKISSSLYSIICTFRKTSKMDWQFGFRWPIPREIVSTALSEKWKGCRSEARSHPISSAYQELE